MQVIWCYGNIAGESLELRNQVLADGVVEPMAMHLDKVTQPNSQAMRNISWCLANFMKGEEPPSYDLILPAIPALVRAIIRTGMDEVLADVSWGFSFISRDSEERILSSLVTAGAIPRLLQLVECEKINICIPAVRTLGNILASENSNYMQLAVQAGVLGIYQRLLNHPKQLVRKEIAWSLANITADSAEMVQACLTNGIIEGLIQHMMHDVNMVKLECIWALTNAMAKSTPQLVDSIEKYGYFTASNYALEHQDPRILYVALEGIRYALEAGMKLPMISGENPFVLKVEQCGLLDKLEELQQHENTQVYNKVSDLLQNFFAEEEDLDAEDADDGRHQPD